MLASQSPIISVVDDDEGLCRAIERSLKGAGYRVRTYNCARDYLADREDVDTSCVLVDISLPDIDGLHMHMEDNADGYDVPTIFITGHANVRTAVEAMKEGAVDLLEKPFEESVLLETVARGVDRGNEKRTYRNELAAVWRCLDTVTPREAEVCALVASGRLNKQIAALIGTTEKTVKVHRARVMRKLGIRSVAELVRVVDRVLTAPQDRLVFDADHHPLPRPRALSSMTSALGVASQQPGPSGPSPLAAARGVYREAATAAECYF